MKNPIGFKDGLLIVIVLLAAAALFRAIMIIPGVAGILSDLRQNVSLEDLGASMLILLLVVFIVFSVLNWIAGKKEKDRSNK